MFNWVRRIMKARWQRKSDTQFGVFKFIQAIAYIQLGLNEYLELNPASLRQGSIRVTSLGARPCLQYKFWPKKFDYKEDMPRVSVILEEERILCKTDSPSESGANDWEVVGLDDVRVEPLHSLFRAFAFYQPLSPEHKKTVTSAQAS